jgi:hypothetical protein
MQSLQKEWTAKGVVWMTILSSAPGQEGYVTASEENAQLAKVHAAPTAAILDPKGVIGREYEARTTPHMFVIDPAGKVIYEGAIDDHPTLDPADIKVRGITYPRRSPRRWLAARWPPAIPAPTAAPSNTGSNEMVADGSTRNNASSEASCGGRLLGSLTSSEHRI